jgi:Ca-activated chloride channel homolog
MRFVGVVLGCGVLLQGLMAQAPVERRAPQNQDKDQVPTLRLESRLVNLPLNVVDEKGVPVAGLGRDDFEILEDGKVQKIAIFEKEAVAPLSIVLSIDASESVLRDERLEKDAAKHFLRALIREQDEVELMDFADTVREVVPFTNQVKRVEAGLNELQHGSDTALYDAIYLASDVLAKTKGDASRRRVMVLITDGGDTVKRGSLYTQALEEAQRAGAMVYSIIIVPVWADAGRNTGGEHALIQMANDTGGKYYYVVEPKDLEPAFRKVSEDLRTQYLLGYYAPQEGKDNSLRKIRVRMKDPALEARYKLRYRTAYYSDTK